MKAKKATGTTRKARPLTIWDGDKYFDATFTEKERDALHRKLMEVSGYDRGHHSDWIFFESDIFHPAQDTIWPAFRAQGLEYDRDHARLSDYTLIHICRELGIGYHDFAANVPKLPIDGFIQQAKRSFPEFKRPRNKIERKIQEHKLHAAWCDWHEVECVRTGCTSESHWLCHDRFIERDYPAIIEEIAAYNETRPKFAPLKLVYSSDSASSS